MLLILWVRKAQGCWIGWYRLISLVILSCLGLSSIPRTWTKTTRKIPLIQWCQIVPCMTQKLPNRPSIPLYLSHSHRTLVIPTSPMSRSIFLKNWTKKTSKLKQALSTAPLWVIKPWNWFLEKFSGGAASRLTGTEGIGIRWEHRLLNWRLWKISCVKCLLGCLKWPETQLQALLEACLLENCRYTPGRWAKC